MTTQCTRPTWRWKATALTNRICVPTHDFFLFGTARTTRSPAYATLNPTITRTFHPHQKKKRKLHNNKQFAEPPFMLKRQSYLGSVVRRRRTSRFKHAMPPKNKTNTSTNPYSFFGGAACQSVPHCTSPSLTLSIPSLSLSLSLALALALFFTRGSKRARALGMPTHNSFYTHNHYDKHFYVFFISILHVQLRAADARRAK